MRILNYAQAVNEAIEQCLTEDKNVIIIGEGVPDGVFGTTKGLQEKFAERVFDSPLSENGVTGFCIGASMSGLRPIMVHQRADFSLLSIDQLANNAAKISHIFGKPCPIVVKMTVGRGWGQGGTHSQSIQALFASIPGLQVIMPTTPYDAKGIMVAAIRSNVPTIILEHRWLYNTTEDVPTEMYEVPFKANIIKQGSAVTLIGISYTTLDCIRAAEYLQEHYSISAEVIDIRSIAPIDLVTIRKSINKTGRLISVDTSHKTGSVSESIVVRLVEDSFDKFKCAPIVLGSKDYPCPTSHFLTEDYYVRYGDIVNEVLKMYGIKEEQFVYEGEHDVPHKNYSITF